MKTFEVICPVYNEQLTIPLFFERMETVFGVLAESYTCNLVFVDNSSTDRSQTLIRELCSKHSWVSLIVMSRNFGYQCSVECGLRNSQADLTGVVDVDCEDPPEMFVDFLEYIAEGYDLAYGERADRTEVVLLKLLRKLYYRVTRATADEHFILDMAEFCVMTRMVREAVCQDHNSYPFIRASIGRVGFELKNVPYKRQSRVAGETHYNMWRMLVFGVAGILSSSTLWLRLPVYIFPLWCVAVLVLLAGLIHTGEVLYYQLLVSSGLTFLAFALTGVSLYLARVYKNGLQRPNYYINHKKSLVGGRRLI